MTLRGRIALATAVAVAFAVLLATVVVYAAASRTLHGEVDSALQRQADDLTQQATQLTRNGNRVGPLGGPRPGRFGGAGAFVQLIDGQGRLVNFPRSQTALPVTDDAMDLAARGGDARFATIATGGEKLRVLTVPVVSGFALQVARPLDEVDAALGHLVRQLVVVGLVGIALAALLGLIVARRGLRPVERLAASVEHVGRTRDLGHRIPSEGDDEPARLARAFNAMLASLGEAREAQDRLVADASHELRTPLTALRANAELLALGGPVDDDDHRRLLDDLTLQTERVGRLVGDLVQLARGAQPVAVPVSLRLDEVAEDAVARARGYWPTATFALTSGPTVVTGDAEQLGRALDNLLANAVVHGGGDVAVTVLDGAVTVADRGPGIAAGDRDRVFARFWRARGAHSQPGSGLGLAIVAQIAAAHGGAITVDEAESGGAAFRLAVPR